MINFTKIQPHRLAWVLFNSILFRYLSPHFLALYSGTSSRTSSSQATKTYPGCVSLSEAASAGIGLGKAMRSKSAPGNQRHFV
jgi:hypothetical protein